MIEPGGIRSEWACIAADKPMIFPHDVLSDRTLDVVMRRAGSAVELAGRVAFGKGG